MHRHHCTCICLDLRGSVVNSPVQQHLVRLRQGVGARGGSNPCGHGPTQASPSGQSLSNVPLRIGLATSVESESAHNSPGHRQDLDLVLIPKHPKVIDESLRGSRGDVVAGLVSRPRLPSGSLTWAN